MNYEEQFDKMTVEEIAEADKEHSEWIASFKEAQAKDGIGDVIPLISSTESPYCLWKMIQYLKTIVGDEASTDPIKHWNGYLARLNIGVCRNKLRFKEQNQ